MSIFTIYLFNSEEVSADENTGCCELTSGGDYCLQTDLNSCNSDNYQVGTACSGTTFCGLGCCWDPDTGKYGKNTPRAVCEAEGKSFDATDPSCASLPALQEGCCELPSGCIYVTRAACRAAITDLTELQLDNVFRTDIQSEFECSSLCMSADVGCFVPADLNANKCTFGFRQEFSELEGDFREGIYCSNIPSCEATEKHSKNCLTPQQSQYFGDDDNVHWFDSLGNPEQVVGSIYTGYVDDVRYETGCAVDQDNTDSTTCGICDSIGQSNICGEVEVDSDVDYQCVSLDCGTGHGDVFKWVDSNDFETGWEFSEQGNNEFNIKNGDAWCYYEGVVGEGRDLVGSRHTLFRCKDGGIISETSGEGRENVCYMSIDEDDRPSAKPIVNEASQCLTENTVDNTCGGSCDNEGSDYEKTVCCIQKECENLGSSCFWDSNVNRCTPQVPPSTLLSESSEVCDVCDYECPIVCEKKLRGVKIEYKCHPTDDCNKNKVNDFNNYCKSVGDCGAWYNVNEVQGEGGYTFTKNGKHGSDIGWLSGVSLDGGVLNSEFTYLNGDESGLFNYWKELKDNIEELKRTKTFGRSSIFGGIKGALYTLGGIYGILAITYVAIAATAVTLGTASLAFLSSATAGILLPSLVTSWWAGGTIVGGTGYEGGILIGSASFGVGGSVGSFILVIAPWLIGFTALFLAEQILELAVYDRAVVRLKFQCSPWNPLSNVPPSVCKSCIDEDNPYDTCTNYECASLGANCEFKNINPDGSTSETGRCESREREIAPPVISPLEIYDDKTYQPIADGGYKIVQKFGYNEPIRIGVKTNEDASCKIFKVRDQDYETMVLFDNEGWQTEHEIELSITNEEPDLDSLDIYGVGEKIYYVKCMDVFDNINPLSYKITFTMDETPDVEPPVVVKFDPINGAFIPYDRGSTNVYLLVQDRSGVDGCRYSLNPDVAFEDIEIENSLTCSSTLERDSEGISGYKCYGQIEDIQNNADNIYYFRCQDKSSSTIENQDDIVYTLKGTLPLVLTDFGPQETVYSRDVQLTATTERGAEDGNAECRYALSQDAIDPGTSYESMFRFSSTNSNQHSHSLVLTTGDYNSLIKCRDTAGNEDVRELSFTVDTPELFITELLPANNSKLYEDSFELKITTEGGIDSNGDAVCYYSFNDQPVGIIPGKEILETQTVHSHNISLVDGEYDFNIMCEDSAGKQVEGFTRIVIEQGAYPRLKAVYTQSGQLYILVNQAADCRYSNELFDNFEDGTAMVKNSDYVHVLNIGSSSVFHIMCRDTRTNNLSPVYTVNV